MADRPKLRIKKGFEKVGGKYVAAAPKVAPKKPESSDESDSVGLHAQLLNHRDLHTNPPKIKFENGESAAVTPYDRNKMLTYFDSLKDTSISPGKREKTIAHASASHENFKQHLDGTYKEKERHPMSAVREEIITNLKKAVEEGILSQNDFDKLTQNEEVESVEEDKVRVGTLAQRTQAYRDEKALSPKQKKIASIAGDKDKIDAEDLKVLRSGKKTVKEEKENEPKVSAYTESNRFRGVESSIRDVMSKNLNLRQMAKEEEFKRNNKS